VFDLDKLIRKNIKELKPYSSARNEYEGSDAILLDANENPFNNPYNRYPDPLQKELKQKIADTKNPTTYDLRLTTDNIFLGNGSDEAIDLLIRAFCEPRTDNIISPDPSYGMYEVCANINNVEFRKVLLRPDFELDVTGILNRIDKNSKLIFICSPNNPTSNSLNTEDVIKIIESFDGLVTVDEAYIDFSVRESFLKDLKTYPNLVILQTFSKSKALAGVRLGMAFADVRIINILNKIKYPYNINLLTQKFAIDILETGNWKLETGEWIKEILEERKKLEKELAGLVFVEKVYPSDSNFLLVKMKNHRKVFDYLINKKIVVRDRSNQKLCERCLRITVGTKNENDILIKALKEFKL
jgi:histidinol-phosphate aminotransferase